VAEVDYFNYRFLSSHTFLFPHLFPNRTLYKEYLPIDVLEADLFYHPRTRNRSQDW
jgi:hypothetical protein